MPLVTTLSSVGIARERARTLIFTHSHSTAVVKPQAPCQLHLIALFLNCLSKVLLLPLMLLVRPVVCFLEEAGPTYYQHKIMARARLKSLKRSD